MTGMGEEVFIMIKQNHTNFTYLKTTERGAKNENNRI